ncbi:MAG: hypothetical protein ACTSRH_09350 [Promethearchaeota archaeon]
MNKTKRRMQLLSLLSIFFIYKAIESIFYNRFSDFSFWMLITAVYIISLIIMYFVAKKYEEQKTLIT